METLSLIISYTGDHSNPDALINGIRYITRTRSQDKSPEDLLCCGAVGVSSNPDDMLEQMSITQDCFNVGSRGGPRVHHEIFNLGKFKNPAVDLINRFARLCSTEYYKLGFQCAYAVHINNQGYAHIHFMVNTISFVNGRKFHTSFADRAYREAIFNNYYQLFFINNR